MDSSQIFGVAEECHSSESGWTMYLQDDSGDDEDAHNYDGDSAEDDDGGDNKSYNDDSDDSMASDASSGPSHQRVVHLKQEEDKHAGRYQMEMKASEPMEKKRSASEREEEKEATAFMEERANNSSAQSDSKDGRMHELKT